MNNKHSKIMCHSILTEDNRLFYLAHIIYYLLHVTSRIMSKKFSAKKKSFIYSI